MVGIRDMVFEGDSEIVLDAVWGYVTPSATIGNDIMLLRGSNNRWRCLEWQEYHMWKQINFPSLYPSPVYQGILIIT